MFYSPRSLWLVQTKFGGEGKAKTACLRRQCLLLSHSVDGMTDNSTQDAVIPSASVGYEKNTRSSSRSKRKQSEEPIWETSPKNFGKKRGRTQSPMSSLLHLYVPSESTKIRIIVGEDIVSSDGESSEPGSVGQADADEAAGPEEHEAEGKAHTAATLNNINEAKEVGPESLVLTSEQVARLVDVSYRPLDLDFDVAQSAAARKRSDNTNNSKRPKVHEAPTVPPPSIPQGYSLYGKRMVICDSDSCCVCASKPESSSKAKNMAKNVVKEIDTRTLINCCGVGCNRSYHFDCLVQASSAAGVNITFTESSVPTDFSCFECDPFGSSRSLMEYFEWCNEERAKFTSSYAFVMSLLETQMKEQLGTNDFTLEPNLNCTNGEQKCDIPLLDEVNGSPTRGATKTRKHDTGKKRIRKPPVSEFDCIEEFYSIAMEETLKSGKGSSCNKDAASKSPTNGNPIHCSTDEHQEITSVPNETTCNPSTEVNQTVSKETPKLDNTNESAVETTSQQIQAPLPKIESPASESDQKRPSASAALQDPYDSEDFINHPCVDVSNFKYVRRTKGMSPSRLIGKTVRLYCPLDNAYHIGRILDWRKASPLLTFDTDSAKESVLPLFYGKDDIGESEFLVRFKPGMNGRKRMVHQWIILDEHSLAVGLCLIWGDKLGKGHKGWRPALLLARSSLELVSVPEPENGDDPEATLKPDQDKQKNPLALAVWFGEDEDESHALLRLRDEIVDFYSPTFASYRGEGFGASFGVGSTSRIVQMAVVMANVEALSQQEVISWNKLRIEDPYSDRGLTMLDCDALPPAIADEPEKHVCYPKLCPNIPQGLDRLWIMNLLHPCDAQRSMNEASELEFKLIPCNPEAMAKLKHQHQQQQENFEDKPTSQDA